MTGLNSAASEKSLRENMNKLIKVRIRDVPVDPGELLEFGNGDLIIRMKTGKRCLIDMNTVIGIEEYDGGA